MSFRRDVTKSQTGPRKRAGKGHKKQFSRTADSVHPINTASPARPMRGGIRLWPLPCYHPVDAYQSKHLKNPSTGKFLISHNPKFPEQWTPFKRPCGQCRGCRHGKAKEWACRCVHEAQLYDDNSFITLTFSDKYLDKKGSLKKRDFQLFMKRLRKHFEPQIIRYYHCGEYGESLGRPHHHALLFNLVFPDAYYWKTENGNKHYRSTILETLWSDPVTHEPFGHALIGPVTYNSAAYVARYVVKKINGKLAPDHYQGRLPEYTSMSRRPGIARGWYEKYKHTDVFPRDYIELNGHKQKVPKYYSRCYELTNPDEYGKLREDRKQRALENPNNDPARLLAAEKLQEAYDRQLKRNYENQTTGDSKCPKGSSSSLSVMQKRPSTRNRSCRIIKLKPFARYKPLSKTKKPTSINTLETFPSGISVNTMIALESLLPNRPPNM